MADRRVVITGIGTIASIGATREAVWSALIAGRSGIRPVTLFDPTGYRSHLAAEIPDLDAAGDFTPRDRRRLSRCDRAAIVAAGEALDDAGLAGSGADPRRTGIMLGSGTADLLRNEDYLADVRAHGFRGARPSAIFNHFPSTPVDAVGERFGVLGPRACIVAACSSSTIAIGYAADAIRRNEIDVALAGGADVLCRLTFSGFNALRLVDVEPCRPFDSARAGMTIGEAAAVLVLEDLDRARRRGASIYAELLGYSATCEAYHPTSPEPEGKAVAATIRAALDAARVNAGGCRPRERPWHRHGSQRSRRGPCIRDRVRRAESSAARDVHQGCRRALSGGGRCDRGRRARTVVGPQRHPTHSSSRSDRSRL